MSCNGGMGSYCLNIREVFFQGHMLFVFSLWERGIIRTKEDDQKADSGFCRRGNNMW